MPKKPIITIFFVLLFASEAEATQVGGSCLPVGYHRLSLGAHVGYPRRNVSGGNGEDDTRSIQFLVRGEYGLHPQFSLFLEGGVSDLTLDGFKGVLGGGFGGGAKGALFNPEEQKLNVSAVLEAFTFQSESSNGTGSVFEYQGALLLDFTSENMTSYGGLKVSQEEVTLDPGNAKFKGEDTVGALFGIDYLITPEVFFNGEIQIYDQQAIYLSVGYRM